MPKLELQPLIPEVVDEDIKWVRRVMDLPTFDQPRQEFLREHTTLDVSACPGSGKTTLIVAKLAIMARKWPHHAKGICVLSHTNAAREEIQHRLRGTVSGQAGLKNQVQRFREISPFPGPSPLQVSASPAFCAAGR